MFVFLSSPTLAPARGCIFDRNSAENSLVVSCSGPVVEITTTATAAWLPAPDDETTGGETKAALRAADVDAGSCLLCGGVCEEEVVCFCVNVIVCGCVKACTMSVCMRVSTVALWLWGTQLGGRVSAFIPALRGRGPHRYPTRGWKAALQMSPAGVQWPSQQMSCLAAGTLLLSHQLLAEASSKGC